MWLTSANRSIISKTNKRPTITAPTIIHNSKHLSKTSTTEGENVIVLY